MDGKLIVLALALAVTVPLSGCVGELVLPKTLDLSIEYAEADAESMQIDGLSFEVSITDPNGTEIFHDEGIVEEGFSRDHQIVFEEVGPYALSIQVSHPEHGSKSFDGEFDFRVLCRTVDHIVIDAVYADGGLDIQMEGGGPLCRLPEGFAKA